jgi:hypothetical protein
MNKRGIYLLGSVISIIIIVAFFSAMLFFVVRAGTQASVIEQVYSKQITLLIDNAKPGMTVNLDVSELYDAAEKNKYRGGVVVIDNQNKKVRVNVVQGRGYEFSFFNDVLIAWELKDEEKKLYMEIK